MNNQGNGSGSDTSSSSSGSDSGSGSDSDKSDDDGLPPPPTHASPDKKRKIEEAVAPSPAPAAKRARGGGKKGKVKGVRSSYMYYCEEKRPLLKAENNQLTFAELAKLLGLEWKALSPEEKQKYKARAEEDKKRYVTEKGEEAERIRLGIQVEAETPPKSKKKKKKGPKGAKSAYMCFCVAERPALVAERPGLNFAESGKILGARWKALAKEERGRYVTMAQEDKTRFKTEKADFDAKEEAQAQAEAKAQPPPLDPSSMNSMFDDHIASLKARIKKKMLREDITENEMESVIHYMVDQSPYELLSKVVRHPSLK